jgi:hypothetical protein
MSNARKPLSPKQRRDAAIVRRFPAWYLTDGRTSPALHIGAAFSDLERDFSRLRARWPFLTRLDRDWHRAIAVPQAIRHSRFCLSLYPNRLP